MIFLDDVSDFPPGLLLFKGRMVSFTKTFVIKLFVFWTGEKLLPEHGLATLRIYWGTLQGLTSPD